MQIALVMFLLTCIIIIILIIIILIIYFIIGVFIHLDILVGTTPY